MLDSIDTIWVFYLCLFGAVVAALDAIFSLATTSSMYRRQVNGRLNRLEKDSDRAKAMLDLRRDRGLTLGGAYQLPVIWLNRLILQSGLTVGTTKIGFGALLLAIGGAAVGYFVIDWRYAIGGFFGGGIVLPILALMYLRQKRKNKFTDQFAEAIDIIVRSLRAGHPVPAAIRLAARELPDPIGTEFGIAEDEMTFGLDLESAMRNMQERVGQDDLPLFVTSVAIQTQSGGNLTEILENLSGVIRQRAKMRRKIRALSAEGRISSYILSSTPIVLFVIINGMNPE
ncbi:MAG: type II secretion system F family protein, partial [Hyphomicrobiales bacterium]|nr:type II secretion system F family protein [Hyphomicrobiales bacterium]